MSYTKLGGKISTKTGSSVTSSAVFFQHATARASCSFSCTILFSCRCRSIFCASLAFLMLVLHSGPSFWYNKCFSRNPCSSFRVILKNTISQVRKPADVHERSICCFRRNDSTWSYGCQSSMRQSALYRQSRSLSCHVRRPKIRAFSQSGVCVSKDFKPNICMSCSKDVLRPLSFLNNPRQLRRGSCSDTHCAKSAGSCKIGAISLCESTKYAKMSNSSSFHAPIAHPPICRTLPCIQLLFYFVKYTTRILGALDF